MQNDIGGHGSSSGPVSNRETFLRCFEELAPFVSHQKETVRSIEKQVSAFNWKLQHQYERMRITLWALWVVLILTVNGITVVANWDSPTTVRVDGPKEQAVETGGSVNDSASEGAGLNDSVIVETLSTSDRLQVRGDSLSSVADTTNLTEADESENGGDRFAVMFLGGNFVVALAWFAVKGRLLSERRRINAKVPQRRKELRETARVSHYDEFRAIYDSATDLGEYLRTGAPQFRDNSWNAFDEYCRSNELVRMTHLGRQGCYSTVVELGDRHEWFKLDEDTISILTAFDDLWLKAGIPLNEYWQVDEDTLRDVHLALVCLSLYEYAKVENAGELMPRVEFSSPQQIVAAESLKCFTETINGISADKFQRVSELKSRLATVLEHSKSVVETLLTRTNSMIDHNDVLPRLVVWLPLSFLGILGLLVLPVVLLFRMALTEVGLMGVLAVAGSLAWHLSRTRRRIQLPGKPTQSREMRASR